METVHRSRRHPDGATRPVVFGSEFVRPLGACMIPVMLGALTAMLTARPPLPFLYVGFPVAASAAAAWAVLQLRRRAVEVRIRKEAVQILSAWEAAEPRRDPGWLSVLDVRTEDDRIGVTLGLDTRWLSRSEWTRSGTLEASLRSAADRFSGRIREGST